MSYGLISSYDDIHVGRAKSPLLYGNSGKRGVEVMLPTFVSFGTPGVADADYLIKAATGNELPDAADPGETVTYLASATNASPHDAAAATTTIYPAGAAVTAWDVRDGATYGRNLISVMTHSSAVVASTVLISGYDYALQPMTELHTITADTTSKTVTGTKAWAYVTSVAITAAADSSANTLNIGTGTKLGLPYALASVAHAFKASFDGAEELINVASNATVVAAVTTSPATNATGDVRGTIAFNGTLNGSKECALWAYFGGYNSARGLLGVVQA
jgi:hypothetical protein